MHPHDGAVPATPPIPAPDVALIPWPADEPRRRQLAAERRPRLLLVDHDADPPLPADHLEDWVRETAAAHEVSSRLDTLARRAATVVPEPEPTVLDADDVLRRGDRWVALAPLEGRVLAALAACAGRIVDREELTGAGWPDGPPADPRAVDGVVKRLRRRVGPLGVAIHTATGRGFLLEPPGGDGVPVRAAGEG